MPIDTRKSERGQLKFDSLDAALAHAQALVQAEREGRIKRTGNWTLGQTLGHLAFWTNASFDPIPMRVPWFVRFFMQMRRKKIFYAPMSAGIRIPGIKGGTLGTEQLSTEEGLARFRAALARFASETPKPVNPAFGPMNTQEWKALNCRHAELHLSFFTA